MNKYFKYLKALLYIFIPLFIFNIILSLFYYFNTISDNTLNIISLISTFICIIIGGIYIGNRTNRKAYLEGLKLGLIISILFTFFSLVIFNKGINIKSLLYYLSLLLTSTLGSMIGISKRKNG